jgi:hypothetical protein
MFNNIRFQYKVIINMPSYKDTVFDIVKDEFSHISPKLNKYTLNERDNEFLHKECMTYSQFDPNNLRKKIYESDSILAAAECKYGKIICLLESKSQYNDIPWELWARILRIYSKYNETKKPFRIFFLANTELRKIPTTTNIHPSHINGGYTSQCDPESIMIYRAEDATRVLIHELRHACCLDNHDLNLNELEAETEACAELMYVTLMSRGDIHLYNELLQYQLVWMKRQNNTIRQYMNNPNSREFPWRYTIGRESIFTKWKILQTDLHLDIQPGNSLRLTYPPLLGIKMYFRVGKDSIIL